MSETQTLGRGDTVLVQMPGENPKCLRGDRLSVAPRSSRAGYGAAWEFLEGVANPRSPKECLRWSAGARSKDAMDAMGVLDLSPAFSLF